jgi:hypothetical protein
LTAERGSGRLTASEQEDSFGAGIIETETMKASRYGSFYSSYKQCDVIDGYDAQVLCGSKVIAEQIPPPALKKAFDSIRPIEGDKKQTVLARELRGKISGAPWSLPLLAAPS